MFSYIFIFFFLLIRRPPISTLFPYTTLFRSLGSASVEVSPRFPTSFSAILRKIRRMILPLRVFGSAGANCSTSGVAIGPISFLTRSEEHTSELQSQSNLVCRLLLEKKKNVLLHLHLFFSTDPPTPDIYTLSLHDALPISRVRQRRGIAEVPHVVLRDLAQDPPHDLAAPRLRQRRRELQHVGRGDRTDLLPHQIGRAHV